jgi:hypothetical protein
MLTEALTALASTGGAALVTAMVTDSWEGVRGRVARLFGRGDAKQTDTAGERLEASRAALEGKSGAELDQAVSEQQVVWRTRLADLLEQDPGAERELWDLVAEIHAQTGGSAGTVVQHAAAYDQAQQAVQGHGVQHNTFGGQSGSGTSSR